MSSLGYPGFVKTLGFVLAAMSALGQQPGTDGVVIRSTTRLVEINVIAQDHSGRYLADLGRQDFTVLDNGKPQTISVFTANIPVNHPPARAPVPNTFTNQVDRRAGYSVILLDWLNTGFSDRAQARQQVIQMLRQIDTADQVAIYVLDQGGLRVIQDIGGDSTELQRKLGAVRQGPGGAAASASPYDASRREISSDLFGTPPPARSGASRIGVEEQVMRLDTRIRDTLAALEAIGRHLAGIQGRKSLIWLSAGIPTSIDGSVIRGASPGERTYTTEIDRAIRRLSNAGVAVYPIDARGLSVSPKAFINIQTMQHFAQRTGGMAYANRNDIDHALRAALDDQRISYTLGFYASGDQSSDAPHHIRVRVPRSGVNLRYREAYYLNETPPTAAEVLSSPVDATALPIALQIVRRPATLDVTITLDPATLSLTPENGRWHGQIEIVPRFIGPDGAFIGSMAVQKIQLDMLPQTYETSMRQGLRFQLPVTIPDGSARLRILVRDGGNLATGSLTVALAKVK